MRVFLNQVRPECNLLQHPRLLSVPLPIRLPRQWNTLCLWVPIACNLNLVLVECSGAAKLTLWLMKRIVLFSRFSWTLYYTTFKKMPPFDNVLQNLNMQCCERFEPRSHFKSRLRLISRVNVVLNRTVVVDSDWRFDNLCGSHLQSQSELYHVSWWYYTLVIDLIGQLRRDVIGRLSVEPWCYWLWRLVISNWCVSIRLLSQLNSRLLLVKLSSSRS